MLDPSSGPSRMVPLRIVPSSLGLVPEAPQPAFAVHQLLARDGDVRVVVRGEADCDAAARFAQALHLAISVARGNVTLDLHRVTFIDSSCLKVLLGAKAAADAVAIPLRVRYADGGPVHRLLSLCSVVGWLEAPTQA